MICINAIIIQISLTTAHIPSWLGPSNQNHTNAKQMPGSWLEKPLPHGRMGNPKYEIEVRLTPDTLLSSVKAATNNHY